MAAWPDALPAKRGNEYAMSAFPEEPHCDLDTALASTSEHCPPVTVLSLPNLSGFIPLMTP